MFTFLPSVLLALAFLAPITAPVIEKEGRVTFSNVTPGDLGKDSTSDSVRQFPVKIMMSSESGIPYGGVFVRIFDHAGGLVFKHLCEKPWLYLKLPMGNYNVIAVDRKKSLQMAPFFVKDSSQKIIKLKWPKSIVGY